MNVLENVIDDNLYMIKNMEHDVKKGIWSMKQGNAEEIQSIQTIEDLSDRISEVVNINLSTLKDN